MQHLESIWTVTFLKLLGYPEELDKEILCHRRYSQQLWQLSSKKPPLDERGINVDGEKLTDLRFADDVALITISTVKDMEKQLNDLNKESKNMKKVRLRAAQRKKKNKIHGKFCTRLKDHQ